MKNKLIDLNNHLFSQLEKLSDEDIKGDDLQEEITRSKAVTGVATQIINNAKLALSAHKAINEGVVNTAPEMLGVKPDGE